MIGIETTGNLSELVQAARDKGLIVLTAGTNVIRLLPPITLSDAEIEKGCSYPIRNILLDKKKSLDLQSSDFFYLLSVVILLRSPLAVVVGRIRTRLSERRPSLALANPSLVVSPNLYVFLARSSVV